MEVINENDENYIDYRHRLNENFIKLELEKIKQNELELFYGPNPNYATIIETHQVLPSEEELGEMLNEIHNKKREEIIETNLSNCYNSSLKIFPDDFATPQKKN